MTTCNCSKPALKNLALTRIDSRNFTESQDDRSDQCIMDTIFCFLERRGAELLLRNLVMYGRDGVVSSERGSNVIRYFQYLTDDDFDTVYRLIIRLKNYRIITQMHSDAGVLK